MSLLRCLRRALLVAPVIALTVFCATSSADLHRVPVGPADVPHNAKAAIYDLFGLNKDNGQIIGTIQQDLSQEGYDVALYRDSTEGAGGHGGGTLANFVKMAKTASVIVINTHGTDFGDTDEQSCTVGKGIGRVPKEGPDVVQICSKHQEPVQQVEWYPTQAALHKAYEHYVTVGGYKKAWLFESTPGQPASTLAKPRRGDLVPLKGLPVGFRPWLGLTTSGIKHFFSGHKIDLIDNQACHSMSFASSYGATAYLGHASTACTSFEAKDEPLLFDRMTGHDNVRERSLADAFELGGFLDKQFQLVASENVTLSPAVESSTLSEGDALVVGAAAKGTFAFDTKMDTSNPNGAVTITGCGGATISGATWNGDGTQLSYAVNVPNESLGGPATLTVHARAEASDGDNAELDGNQQPSGDTDGGVEPNGDDYVIHLVCHARSFPVMVDYAGTYTDDYTEYIPILHSQFTWHETLSWHETQTYRILFTGTTTTTPGPATVTASGTLTETGGSPPDDNCTIASIPGVPPAMNVPNAQETPSGGYIASFVAGVPILTATAGVARVQVTGTPDNCIVDTVNGIEPYLYYHPENQGFDPGGKLETAWYGSMPNVDLGGLVAAPLVVPFNADYVENDPTGGSDHVVVNATATISLTGAPGGM
jgi:hypothetical protein